MLTVITPATSKRLTTVSTVRDELGITTAEASDDTVNRWIDYASQAIVDYCATEFAEQTYLEEVYAPPANRARILLSRFPVTSVTEAKYGGDVMPVEDYRLDDGYFYRLSASGRPVFWGPSQIAIQYVAGYTLPGTPNYTLPPTIEQACIDEISARRSRLARDPLIRSETEDGVGATTYQVVSGTGSLTHPDSAGNLERYRMVLLG